MSLNVNNNVGYTVVDGGSISVVNGIASGFSTNDYLDLSQKIDITQNVHIHIDVLSFAATGSSQYVFGFTNGDGSSSGLYFGTTAVSMAFSYGSSYWTNIATGLTVGAPLTVDVVSNGIDFSITVNQGTYTKTSTKTLTDLGITGSYTLRLGKLFQAFTSGAINLNKTYVKINGITWFNGKQTASTTVNDVYLNRNVGYTKVGNPTIVDGVASGFSNSDYLEVPITGLSSWKGIEIVVSSPTTFSAQGSTQTLFSKRDDFYIYITSNGSFQIKFIGDNNYYGINLPTEYLGLAKSVKLKFSTNDINMYYSLNGTTFELGVTVNSFPSQFNTYSKFVFGSRSYSSPYSGSIDLNNTYIKVNGVTWFNGNQTATTPIWTRSV